MYPIQQSQVLHKLRHNLLLNVEPPEWFYRELTSIRKDVSVLDATGASKEQIQELKERIGKVEVRLEETQLRVDGKLNEQSGRIGDIHSFISQMGWLIGIVITIVTGLAAFFNINARSAAVNGAKEAANEKLVEWTQEKEAELTEKFDKKLAELSEKHEKEFQKIRDNAEEQSFESDINEAYSLASKDRNDEAMSHINNVIKQVKNSDLAKHQRIHAKALYYKALIFDFAGQPEREVSTYDDLIKRFIESKDISIQEQVAKGLVNKATNLGERTQLGKAIAIYEELFERFKGSEEISIQEQVATALCNKAELVLVTESEDTTKKAIQDVIFFIKDGYKGDRAVMEMLSFIIEESTVSYVLSKIEDIPESETIEWGFNEIRPVIENLEFPRKEQVEAFARFFEEHKDKTKLKEELDQISKL